MRSSRVWIVAAGLVAVALVPVAVSAEAGSPEVAPTFPKTGTVNADLVNVRCGPNLYYYPLATLAQGTKVTVQAREGGWMAIDPPAGVYGLVHRSDVTIDEDGTTATVTSPEARVYASSARVDRHWCVAADRKSTRLNSSHRV